MKKWCQQLRKALGSLCLVDRVLMLFMAVLLFSMAAHLFDRTAVAQEAGTIDVIIRTSASAIFGYFISGNFLKKASPAKEPEKPAEAPAASCGGIQVMVVSVIGMASLVLLLVARGTSGLTAEFAATVSQLRDFVAACVGFLVSCGKNSE